MVWNSWNTLSEKPRVFKSPKIPIAENMIVCGSGPSLDKNLDTLQISVEHIWLYVDLILGH